MGDPPRPVDGRSALLGLLVAAVVANVAGFPAVERALPSNYGVSRLPADRDLLSLIGSLGLTGDERFEFYGRLRAWAPEATLTVPAGTRFFHEHLFGLGAVRQLIERDPGVGTVPDLQDAQVVRGEDVDVGRYVIAVRSVPATHLVGIEQDGVLYLVDRRLLPPRTADGNGA